jgi:predicted nucleotidyltransferase
MTGADAAVGSAFATKRAGMTYPGGWRPIPYAERCRERRVELQRALDRAIETCRRRAEVLRLLVFGSFARDEVSPWSDLDLLVMTEGDASGAVQALYEAGTLGDVLGMSAADAEARLGVTPLGRTILAEAIEVYADPGR